MQATYNIASREWDRFKLFYYDLNRQDYCPFFIFETGEIIMAQAGYWSSRTMVSYRRKYPKYNVSIMASHDYQLPPLVMEDGTKVVREWLIAEGVQNLLVDHDTNVVVGIGRVQPEQLPEQFRHINALRVFFPSAGAEPIGAPIAISRPVKYSAEQKAKLNEIRAACKAWAELSEEAKPMQCSNRYAWTATTKGDDPEYFVPKPLSMMDALHLDFSGLKRAQRMQVARYGYVSQRYVTRVPRLCVASNV